jgi:hypothetical protein
MECIYIALSARGHSRALYDYYLGFHPYSDTGVEYGPATASLSGAVMVKWSARGPRHTQRGVA